MESQGQYGWVDSLLSSQFQGWLWQINTFSGSATILTVLSRGKVVRRRHSSRFFSSCYSSWAEHSSHFESELHFTFYQLQCFATVQSTQSLISFGPMVRDWSGFAEGKQCDTGPVLTNAPARPEPRKTAGSCLIYGCSQQRPFSLHTGQRGGSKLYISPFLL